MPGNPSEPPFKAGDAIRDLADWVRSPKKMPFLRKAVLALGVVLCLTALSARYIGLGTAEEFLFYKLWHIRRSDLFNLGLVVMLVSLAPPYPVVVAALCWIFSNLRDAGQALRGVRLSIDLSAKHDVPFWPMLARQGLLAGTVALVAFSINSHELLGYIDGHYLLTLIRNQFEFAAHGPFFSTNPLEGLNDVWYTTNTLWIPEARFSGLFSDVAHQRIAFHWFAFAEIFLAAALLSRWIGNSSVHAVAGGWLAVIMISPLTYPSLIYNVPPDAPNIATSITFPILIVVLWDSVGRGRIWSDAVWIAAIAALLWIHFVAVSIITAVAYPFIGCICLVQTVFAWPRRTEFVRKLAGVVVLVVLITVSGLPQILLGLIGDTAFSLMPGDLPTRTVRSLLDGSILLRPEPFAWWVALFGVLGIVLHVVFGQGRIRQFAAGMLVVVAVIVVLGVANAFVNLPGAPPIYYEFVVWPIYAVFAVSVLFLLAEVIWTNVPETVRNALLRRRRVAWIALPLAAVLVFHGANRARGLHNPLALTFPPAQTAIVEHLRSHAALTPGGPYRGRVATMTGQNLPAAATWGQMYTIDIELLRATGNDHRTVGLWYFNIPTLVEFSQTLAPLIYIVVKRYLADRDDVQYRNILNMRRPDLQVLRLLGVRYVISDADAPARGTRRLVSIPARSGVLALDEVPDPNLGVSPTQVEPLALDRSALEWLGRDGVDFRRMAQLSGADPGALVPASDINLTVEQGGIRVEARSSGRSLVVVPFQFSHCLKFVPRSGRSVELRRADLLLTGIIFDGRLDGRVEYRQGPFVGQNCRFHDLADDRAIVKSLAR